MTNARVLCVAWRCSFCEVGGTDPAAPEPVCWCCGGPVTVTARPTVPLARWLPPEPD